MRDYAKIAPTFWTGDTGKKLRKRGIEGPLVALYLCSAPLSNMLGLYYQPILFMAHETGLGEEGARKGLADCIEVGFCHYDEESEVVFVPEMAKWQVAESLKATDNRCAGLQRDYETLPDCPFLGMFFDRYAEAFHLTKRRDRKGEIATPPQAPPKPLRSQEQEQEQAQEQEQEQESASKSPRPTRKCPASFLVTADLQRWAREEVPDVDIRVETAKLRDHTFKTAITDWDGAWRNWMRRAATDSAPRRAPAASTSAASRLAETQRLLGHHQQDIVDA